MANKPDKVEKLLKEARSLEADCENFAEVIKSTVRLTLQNEDIKYQSISHRVKGRKSLEDKLSHPNAPTIKKSVKELNDLVGCRVTFYLEKERDAAYECLKSKFEVVNSKQEFDDSDYKAIHLIVKLNGEGVDFGESEKLKTLQFKCEIQLTTVIYHAWAELEHSVIYKRSESIDGFDDFYTLKSMFSIAMKEHLKKAQAMFELIYTRGESSSPGNSPIHIILNWVSNSTTSSDIYTSLGMLKSHLQQLDSQVPEENEISDIIKDVLIKSKIQKEELAPGGYPVGYEQIVGLCLEILELKQHFYADKVFDILRELSIDTNPNVSQKALDSISKMAKYVYSPNEQKLSYRIQLFLLDEIKTWNETELRVYLHLITKIAEKLLSPSFDGMSWDGGKTAYLLSGALPADNTVKEIRLRAIEILRNLYHISKTTPERQMVLQALKIALIRSRVPKQNNTVQIDTIILENANSIIPFYSSIVENAELEVVQTIKEQLHLCSIWFKEGLEGVETLQSLITGNAEYQIYDVLVGWNRGFSPVLNFDSAGKLREQKIDEYIEQITDSNFPQWRNRILTIIKNYEQERNQEFTYLRTFLCKLGKRHHTIAKRLVIESEFEFRHFLSSLVLGLSQGGQTGWVIDLLKCWVQEGKYLSDSAFLFQYVQEADIQLLNAIYRKAEELKDTEALINIIASVIANHALHQTGKGLLIDCVKKLTEFGNASWLDWQVFKTESPIWKTLTKDDWKVILENQIISPNINYYMECILVKHAKEAPHLVIDFFRQRTNKSEKQGYSMDYNAIPITMQSYLREAFEKNAKPIVCEILRWIEDDLNNLRKSFSAANLLKEIFPHFHPELERQLIEIVTSGGKDRMAVVFRVLNTYNGNIFLHNVCKEIVKAYPGNQKYEQALFKILADTSSMGASPPFERVFLEYYQSDKKRIQEWKLDKHPAIQNFVAIYEKRLDEQIARLQDYLKNNQPPEENDPPTT